MPTVDTVRPWLPCALLGLLLCLPTCGSSGSSTPPATGPLPIGLEVVASGLAPPVHLTHAGDGSGRLFVALQTGVIRVIDAGGTLLPTPFLDLSALLPTLDTTYDERGLLGLAFHPDFAANGRVFVRTSRPRAGMAGEPCFGTGRGCHASVLSEFLVPGDPTTTNVADAGSERILLSLDQPEFNHNAGGIAFGPDGYLYVGLGDGGGAGDGLAGNPPLHGPLGHGQDVTTPFGAILRLDVDGPPDPGKAYAVPPGNPFVGLPGVDEIYAYGFRNPYRFSFDDGPGGTGRLFCADVGQRQLEELNDVALGANHGWAIREGTLCFDPDDPTMPPPSCASTGPSGEPLVDPVLVYDRTVGISIIGGHVYRGSAVPALSGLYVFGDWASDFGNPNGRLFACAIAGPGAFLRRDLQIQPGPLPLGGALMGLGEDEAGELYALTTGSISPTATSGRVVRIVAAP